MLRRSSTTIHTHLRHTRCPLYCLPFCSLRLALQFDLDPLVGNTAMMSRLSSCLGVYPQPLSSMLWLALDAAGFKVSGILLAHQGWQLVLLEASGDQRLLATLCGAAASWQPCAACHIPTLLVVHCRCRRAPGAF